MTTNRNKLVTSTKDQKIKEISKKEAKFITKKGHNHPLPLSEQATKTETEMKQDRIINFFTIPYYLERFFFGGCLICLDAFVYMFTFLPIEAMCELLFLLNSKSSSNGLERKQQLFRCLMIAIVCILLLQIDASRLYHSIRTQSDIKLYVIFNVLEILDRLFASLGLDILGSFFGSLEAQKRKIPKILHFAISTLYVCTFFLSHSGYILFVVLHAMILFYQSISLQVAINSYNNALLTLLLSNQFIEIKGSVFKKFDKDTLQQLAFSDIYARFQLGIYLFLIAIGNHGQTKSGQGAFRVSASSWIVLCVECFVDWMKHAFITKFNNIDASHAYTEYTRKHLFSQTLDSNINTSSTKTVTKKKSGKDFIIITIKRLIGARSVDVCKRIGFSNLPLTALFLRICWQNVGMDVLLSNPLKMAMLFSVYYIAIIDYFISMIIAKLILGFVIDRLE